MKSETGKRNSSIGYWLFKARNKNPNAPLVVWIEGGPGCSSEQAAFMEHGPYRLSSRDNDFASNPYSWNNAADLLFLDQPLGTGLSNCSNSARIPTSSDAVAADFQGFFTNFLATHKEYDVRTTTIYFAGHSYAGRFVPAIVTRLLNRGFPYKIAAVALGNAYVDPHAVTWSYPVFAYEKQLTSLLQYWASTCARVLFDFFVQLGMDKVAYLFFKFTELINVGFFSHRFVTYDIRGVTIPFGRFEHLMHSKVLKELGLAEKPWANCNGEIMNVKLALDHIVNYRHYVEELLNKNMTMMFYYGVEDFICNVMSWDKMLQSLNWTGIDEFRTQPYHSWWTNGKLKGEYKRFANLWHINVLNAGHIVFYNEPEFGYDLITKLLSINT